MLFTNNYGLEPMSVEAELNLPENKKKTRNNKVVIVNTCCHIIDLAECIKTRAKWIPEEDDTEHAKLVDALACEVIEALEQLKRADNVGRH